MNNTVFGKIIRGEIPATKLYEDTNCLAFMDINPITKGHTLLIPKEQYHWFQDTPDDLISLLFVRAKHIALAMKKALGCDYVQVVVEGKDVPHFHIHLIPSFFDHKTATWEHVTYEDTEMNTFAEKIKAHL